VDDIDEDELRAFKALAAKLLTDDEAAIALALSSRILTEAANDG